MRERDYELIAVETNLRPSAPEMVGRLVAVAAVAALVVVVITNDSVRETVIGWQEQLLSVL